MFEPDDGAAGRGRAPLAPKSLRDRIACESLLGLSVGDGLGASLEGAGLDVSRLVGELTLEDSSRRWTDDTQMALGIVEMLLAAGTIEQDRLAAIFGRRYDPRRGYGPSMHVVLPKLREGDDWRALKDAVFPGGSFGNGSAMRVAPLGAYFHDAQVETIVDEAERSAEVTHAHAEALAGAAATAVAASLAARSRGGVVPSSEDLFSAVLAPLDPSSRVSRGLASARELGASAGLETAVTRLGNGRNVSCADTVPLAVWIGLRHLDDYPTAIRHAMAAGGDTDTIAAIVGGIVAARVGIKGIPETWQESVESIPVNLPAT